MKPSRQRAFIVRFAKAQDLYDLILKLKLPNEKTPIVKSNRDYRTFAKSEFHAFKEMETLKIEPSSIESIFKLNS